MVGKSVPCGESPGVTCSFVSMFVDVAGGALAVESFSGTSEPILAIHGVSSHRKLWSWLHAEAPDLTLIAPDLRGRADSFEVEGVSSMDQHADDMIAVLDALKIESAHVCGMSMGGFVAINLAVRYPDRVKSLVLVDGGFPMAQAPGLTPEMLPTVFADRLDRLKQRWESLDDFVQAFTSNTAPLLDPQDPLLREYLQHDLVDGFVRLSGEALLSDAADIFFSDNPWPKLDLPVRMSYAEWSVGSTTSGAYSAESIEEWKDKLTDLRFVPGVDHAGSIMTHPGARVVAELLREALA